MPVFSLAFLLLQFVPNAQNCAVEQPQQMMNQCAAWDFAQADEELNALWPTVVAEMRQRDQYIAEYDRRPGAEATLRAAQRAWITFRDAHCATYAYAARGGSLELLLYNGCRADETRARIQQLRDLRIGS